MSSGDDGEKYERLNREVKAGMAAIGLGGSSGFGGEELPERFSFDKGEFGICTTCEFFFATATEFGGTDAACDNNSSLIFRLGSANPIMKCSRYEQKGAMSIRDMKQIAILIDPGKKGPIGLIKKK